VRLRKNGTRYLGMSPREGIARPHMANKRALAPPVNRLEDQNHTQGVPLSRPFGTVARLRIWRACLGAPRSFREALEGALSEQPVGRDVAKLDLGHERRLDPRRLEFLDRFRQLGFRAPHGIELLPDLAGHGSGPAGADLAHVYEVIPFPLAKVQGGDAGWVLHEADHGEFSLLHGFDFQPCFVPVGSVQRVGVLGDDAFPVQLGSVLEHLLPVADEVFGVDDRRFNSFEERCEATAS
jgi:hypothetical protein